MPQTKKPKTVTNPEPIIFFYSEDTPFSLRNRKQLRDWINTAILQESALPGPVNFIFCSDIYLLQLNETYLKHNTYTDIITFDYSLGTGIHRIVSGDIYISIDRVRDNARTFGVRINHELHRVMIHGILHLVGYKDKQPSQKQEMTGKEDYYLSLLVIS